MSISYSSLRDEWGTHRVVDLKRRQQQLWNRKLHRHTSNPFRHLNSLARHFVPNLRPKVIQMKRSITILALAFATATAFAQTNKPNTDNYKINQSGAQKITNGPVI